MLVQKHVLFKKKFISFLLVILPSLIFSQENNLAKNENNQGVIFSSEPNWQAVLNKARKENKYIFVDAFTTWCKPCKTMAAKTFPDAILGNYINSKFVAVKLQMDTSKTDNDHVKAWYADAKSIDGQYKIKAYPTILFFNPNGKLVHKAVGYKEPKELEDIAREATDVSKQLYTQLEQYKVGKISIADYPALANKFEEISEKKIAKEIAAKYIASLSNKNIYTKDNLAFISKFTNSVNDKTFNVFYKNKKKVDEVMGVAYYSQDFVDYLISKEYIDPYFNPYMVPGSAKNAADPDWNKMYKTIKKKYDATYADRVITAAKTKWYGYDFKEQWPEFIYNQIKYTEVYDRPEFKERTGWYYGLGLNNWAWIIFEHSNDPEQLKIALKWSKLATEKMPDNGINLDTYANLLYKLGRKDEAIQLEEKALSLDPNNKDLIQGLEKMKAGLPTWPH